MLVRHGGASRNTGQRRHMGTDDSHTGKKSAARLGHFRVGERLGSGAFGTVFSGTDVHLHRPVAIKVLDHAMMSGETVRRRFFREARVLANLDHPAIVRIYYAGSSDQGPFYAMELLTGGSLRVQLKRVGALEEHMVVQLLEDILPGLGTLHDAGVVHRDLKPANILYTDNGRAKIADFGLALEDIGAQLTTAGSVLGTPPYLAPEQWQGEKSSVQGDLYAVGVIAYECLTGALPHAATSLPELANRVCNTPIDFDPVRQTDHGERWVEFLQLLLAKRPDARPDSAWAVLNRLSPLRSGQWVGTVLDEETAGPGAGAPPTASAGGGTADSGGATLPMTLSPAVSDPHEAAAQPTTADAGTATESIAPPRIPPTPQAASPSIRREPRRTRPLAPPRERAPASAVPASPAARRWERPAALIAAGVAVLACGAAAVLAVSGRGDTTELDQLRALVTELEAERTLLEDERRRLSIRNVELQGQLTTLTNRLFPDSEALALNTHLRVNVAGAQCGIRFTQPAGSPPQLTFEVTVLNTTSLSLPGTMEIQAIGATGESVGYARIPLLRGAEAGRLAPGQQQSTRGTIRLPTAEIVPARFRLRFVEDLP